MRKFKLKLTCGACPEQYDVYCEGERVGYLRLRHGYFRAEYPYDNGEIVYEAHDTQGDGVFEADERDYYLRCALSKINDAMDGKLPDHHPPAPEVEYEIEYNGRY